MINRKHQKGTMESRRNRRKQNKEKKGGLLIFFIIGIIGTIGGFVFNAMLNKQDIDEATNCPIDGVNYHKVILIDTSQSYNPIQKKWIKNQLKKIVYGTKENEKISIYAVGANYHETLLPLQSKCNPGDASGVNPFLENKRMKQEDWENEFIKPLNSVFKGLLDNDSEGMSPIMEMIQAISIAAFQNEKTSTKRKLFIFSDMIQNSEVASHYKDSINFQEFKDSPMYLKVRTDLTGVTVRVGYIRRLGQEKIQKGTAHAKFWQEYFNSMGAAGFSIKFGEG